MKKVILISVVILLSNFSFAQKTEYGELMEQDWANLKKYKTENEKIIEKWKNDYLYILKKITLYNESPIPAVYRFLPATNRVVRDIKNETYDLAVILDCGDLQRIGKAVSTVRQIPVIVNIDHHVTNTRFCRFQLIDT